MVLVQRSDERCENFKKNKIVKTLLAETNIVEEDARKVARAVERQVKKYEGEVISSATIREIVDSQLFSRGELEEAKKHQRIGVPASRVMELIKQGSRDNSNLYHTPETIHKVICDETMKMYALEHFFPPEISRAHVKGDIHISDLDYAVDRPLNCLIHDLRYIIKHGLKVDGTGCFSTSANPARRIATLVNHTGQALQAGQTNLAGGQAVSLWNVFFAPFATGLSYEEIKSNIQAMVFQFGMSFVSRGGQSQSYSTPLILKREENVTIEKIGKFVEEYDDLDYETLSLNRETGKYEWKPINAVYRHETVSPMVRTRLHDGRYVDTTSDHSLFSFDEEANIIEVKPSEELDTILAARKIEVEEKEPEISDDMLFLIGLAIGDGYLRKNNGAEKATLVFHINDEDGEVMEKIKEMISSFSEAEWRYQEDRKCKVLNIPTSGLPHLIKEIGDGSSNKKIPEEILNYPLKNLRHLLDGLMSSDGGNHRNRLAYTTTSEELITQLQFILLRFGYEYGYSCEFGTSNFKRNYPVHRVLISAKDSHKIKLTCKRKQCVDEDSISQHRHNYKIMQGACNKPRRMPNGVLWNKKNQWYQRKLKRDGLEANKEYYPDIWDKIKDSYPMEVESQTIIDKDKYVYDIGVEDNENFVLANGIVAHNSVFSSVNTEFTVPKFLRDEEAWGPDGKRVGTYGDFENETRLINRAFTEVMAEGDSLGKAHRFPNAVWVLRPEMMTKEFEEDLLAVHEVSSKHSLPYFLNLLPDDGIESAGVLGCRSRLNDNWKGEYDTDVFTGNATYNTINLNRVALESKDEDEFFDNLEDKFSMLREVSYIRLNHARKCLNEYNLMPFLKQENGNDKYYNLDDATLAIGYCGLNEALVNLGFEGGILNQEGDDYGIKVLKRFNEVCSEYRAEDNYRWSVIATPMETGAGKFAELDLKYYKDAFVQGPKEAPYLTNSSHAPVDANITLSEKVEIESKYHPLSLGGNILNLFIGEAYPDSQGLLNFTKKIAQTDTGFFAYTGVHNHCYTCGINSRGLVDKCNHCSSTNMITQSRITGYMSTISQDSQTGPGWNRNKVSELYDRKHHEF